MRFLWLVGLSLIVQSCGASWHLKRAIAKDPDILADAIIKVDTTIVSEERHIVDTLIIRDTITQEVQRDGVIVKIKRIHDTIQISATCLPDTIRLITEVPIEQVVIREKAMPLYRRAINIMYLILAILILAWVYRLTK